MVTQILAALQIIPEILLLRAPAFVPFPIGCTALVVLQQVFIYL